MYKLSSVSIRTDNSENGLSKIFELWNDIITGKLPVEFDGTNEHFPIAKYCEYESDETGAYTYSVMSITKDFIVQKEQEVKAGKYRKYEKRYADGDLATCTRDVWMQVYADQRNGEIKRAFTADFEMGMAKHCTPDQSAYCRLYIAVE